MTEHPIRSDILDFVLINREVLVENMKIKFNPGCSAIVRIRILSAVRRIHCKITALVFKTIDIEFFRHLHHRVPVGKMGSGRPVII